MLCALSTWLVSVTFVGVKEIALVNDQPAQGLCVDDIWNINISTHAAFVLEFSEVASSKVSHVHFPKSVNLISHTQTKTVTEVVTAADTQFRFVFSVVNSKNEKAAVDPALLTSTVADSNSMPKTSETEQTQTEQYSEDGFDISVNFDARVWYSQHHPSTEVFVGSCVAYALKPCVKHERTKQARYSKGVVYI